MSPFQLLVFTTTQQVSTIPHAANFPHKRQAAQSLLKEQLRLAKTSYKKKRSIHTHTQEGARIVEGDLVWLSTKILTSTSPSKKLDLNLRTKQRTWEMIQKVASGSDGREAEILQQAAGMGLKA